MRLDKNHLPKALELRLTKVLVIEDDKETAEVVKMFLSMNGYFCQTETGTIDISLLLQQTLPDIVIVDYLLPFINGGELCTFMKQDTRWNHIPVIIYSAYPRVIHSLGDYNCDAFIAKPFELHALLEVMEDLLNHKLKSRLVG
jgi:DNA-binding response OmpR family regulator